MPDTINLDVLVVYSASMATSASVSDTYSLLPFKDAAPETDCNRSYSYFLEACKKKSLTAGFTTSSDIIGPGKSSSFWTTTNGVWSKNDQKAQAEHIFDKVAPSTPIRAAERHLLLSDSNVTPFNTDDLIAVFYDKLKTYKLLREYSIPTVGIDSSDSASIKESIHKLELLIAKHDHQADFGKDFVLKDRHGAGGHFVYKITKNAAKSIQNHLISNPTITFILQPFLNFDSGFTYKDNQTATDIRLIIQNNQILQTYLRMAKAGDFRCNEHQGGQVVYISDKDLPEAVRSASQIIIKKIGLPRSLYALDFAVSNSGRPFLMEGNIGPGLNWDPDKHLSEKMSKQLIRSIVDEIAVRVQTKQ